MNYLNWAQEKITDHSPENISSMYERGFVFTRIDKGVMHQTRSVRIDLKKFLLSSENRRILKKGEEIIIKENAIPYLKYDWQIGKLAKDFYDKKASGSFSVNKIKVLLTEEHNFNTLFSFSDLGYAICYKNNSILHYSYPFYDLEKASKDMGLIMMIKAIEYAQMNGLQYVYLGSLQRPTDTYKLQFSGMEWFDGKEWSSDMEEVKKVLAKTIKHLHIIGICGVATSAIAIAFKEKGWKVTGSDKGFFPPVSTELEKHGILFYAGWHPENIGKPDMVIVGTASGTLNPETAYIKENNIPIYSYPEALGKFFVKENSIVCCGTWGKTSSTALMSFILEKGNINPTYMFGGISLSHNSSAKLTENNYSVFEGDEYKSSPTDSNPKFTYYKPTHLLLTAISWDHADLYPTEESYFNVFKDLISKTKFIVANKDNNKVRELVKNAIWYGKKDADYVYSDIRQTKDGLNFKINGVDIYSPMIGEFQAENITGCFAMAKEIGIEEKTIIKAIAEFKGLKRRLEKRFEGKVTVFDDIAHSPEKVSSVLRNLRAIYNKEKIVAIFEPNIGGRQRASAYMYDNAFKDADTVLIPHLTKLKISESETPMEGEELAKVIGKTHTNSHYIEDDKELVKKTITSGEVIVFLGSHGFRGMIEEVITSLRQQSQ